MNTLKRLLSIIGICVLCLTAQAQVVIGVTRTGQTGTAGENLEFVDQFGNIVAHPTLSPNGGVLDAMRPSVVTNLSVTEVTKTSAATGGTVVNPGASALTECGVCYGTSPNPTTQDSHIAATPDADGNFSVNLTGLQPNTTYYVRAYATNAIGTSYGTSMTFTTRGDATITITGASESKIYNATAQSLTGYTVSIPDGVNITDTEISYTGNAVATGTNVGEYPLTLAASDFSCSNSNYDVTFQVTDGYLTITPAPATVSITGNHDTKVYNAAEQSVTGYTVSIPAGVNITENQITTTATATAKGTIRGDYYMRLSADNFSCTNANYNVTFQVTDGYITITPAPATVTAVAATKEYGAADPTFTATVTGLKNNDDASVINYTLSRAAGEDAGTYAITPTGEATQGNYTVTYVPADFTITPAAATVTASAKEKVYGETDPTFTATISGLRNPNDASQITYSLSRVSGQDVGTYTITPTGATTQGNYTVAYHTGTLTITPAAATVTADDKTKVAGESDPQFTATVTGLKRNDQPSVLNYSLSRATGETVGTYAITPTGAATQGNYTVTYQTGTLTITESACPTLGATTYTPDPVTSSATAITLTTPVNDVTVGATVINPQYTVQVGNTTSTVTGTYSNGTMTGTITITSAMRGSAITVTPSITTAGCSNPGTVTGQAVEICVPYATRPSFSSISNTPDNPLGKTNLFGNRGVDLEATVSNYTASQVESYGFLISTKQSDIQSYSSEFAVPATKSGNTIKSTKLGLSYCGKKWFYRAYIKLNDCEEPVLSTVNNFQMWGPESANSSSVAGPTVSASPASITQGQSVTLSATAYITVSSSFYDYVCSGIVGQNPIEWATHNCENVVSSYGLSRNNWTYRWEDESGNTIYSSHDSGATTVTPTKTTKYTAYGEFVYQNETCRVSKSIEVTVTP